MSQYLIGRTLAGLAVVASGVIVAGHGADSAPPAKNPSSTVTESPREAVDLPIWTTRECPTEDSVNCRHHATRPNGHTFVVRQVPGSARLVCVFYAERRYAATHDYCTSTR